MSEKASSPKQMDAGAFFSAVVERHEIADSILSVLRMPHGRKFPRHAHMRPYLCLLVAGEYCEQYGRNLSYLQAFDAAFRPAEHPHEDQVGPKGAMFFGVELGQRWQETISECSDDRIPGTSGLNAHYDCRGGELSSLTRKLYIQTRTTADALSIESTVAEIAGLLARIKPTHKEAPPWFASMLEKLHQDFASTLSLTEIASAAQVHPVHASRVFRRVTGQGIGEYVQRLRIRAACQKLLDPEQPLAELGAELGFADQSHFTRVFHAQTGVAPGAFRRILH
jgi:AraC family transcriptional regulator